MTRPFLLAALALAAAAAPAPAQAPPAPPLFADDTPLRLTIRGPIAAVAVGKAPLAAALTVQGPAPETLPVRLSPRGVTRRRRETCSFPPLKLAFARPAPPSLFAGQRSLKLVTHCRARAAFQQHLLLEYAAYRMYQALTPAAFRTRLARIDYLDPAGRPIASRFGFLIEDVRDLARRNGMEPYRTAARISPARLDAGAAARFAMFQAMIGNLDWAMVAGPPGAECCHNAKPIGGGDGSGALVPVPYDFDFSGLVDAPYASPPEGVPVANVRERRYRGYCRHAPQAAAAAALIGERRSAILAALDAVPDLPDRPRRKARAYLQGFFDRIATPRGLAALTATCLG